jgi:hypothetical protein
MAEITKHPDAIAWDNWKQSGEGKKCLSPDILKDHTEHEYLLNRLECAFQAGIKHGKNTTNEH